MKAISLWQPWASLIAVGSKRYETRSWSTNHRGLIAIHAAKRWTDDQFALCWQSPFMEALDVQKIDGGPSALPRGAIVAIAELFGCFPTSDLSPDRRERAFGDWSPGRFAWQFSNVVPLTVAVPAVGRQGIFTIDSSLISQFERSHP